MSTDEVEASDTAGSSSLAYDSGSKSYTYVWKTEKAWSGTCPRLILGLDDSTQHTAYFKFR